MVKARGDLPIAHQRGERATVLVTARKDCQAPGEFPAVRFLPLA